MRRGVRRRWSDWTNPDELAVSGRWHFWNWVVLILCVVGAVAAIWYLPRWYVSGFPSLDAKDRVSAENDARSTVISLLGFLLIVHGIDKAKREIKATEQTTRGAHQSQLAERFSKATEQLGHKTLQVRLGGVYALERVARDSESSHWAVMEMLTAFAREHTPVNPLLREARTVPADLQATLTVIGRRDARRAEAEPRRLDLRGTDLRSVDLSGVDLRGALLSHANLAHADLAGADLREADLRDAVLDDAYAVGAKLVETMLNRASLLRADLSGSDLTGANLSGAKLARAHLVKATLDSAEMFAADLEWAILTGAKLMGTNLTDVSLRGVDATDARGLRAEQVAKALHHEEATLPPGASQ